MTPRSSHSSSATRKAVHPASAAESVRAPSRPANDHSQAETPDALEAQAQALMAEAARRREEAAAKKAAEEAARANALAAVPPEALPAVVAAITKQVTAQLDQRGYVPKRRVRPTEEVEHMVPDREHTDTARVQQEFLALLELKGAVRLPDILEHIEHKNGGKMSPENARHHMLKMAAAGRAYVAVEQLPVNRGAGWRYVMTRTPEDMVNLVWKRGGIEAVAKGNRKPTRS